MSSSLYSRLIGDGYIDLVFHFDIQVVVGLDLTTHVGETIPLIVEGNLVSDAKPWAVGRLLDMRDANRDGYINIKDIQIDRSATNFGWSGSPGGNPADINSDDKVNVMDLHTCSKNQRLRIWTYFLETPILGQDCIHIIVLN